MYMGYVKRVWKEVVAEREREKRRERERETGAWNAPPLDL